MSPMSAPRPLWFGPISDWLEPGRCRGRPQTKVRLDLTRAEDILDADHYGLEEVKERILEYLAVQSA